MSKIGRKRRLIEEKKILLSMEMEDYKRVEFIKGDMNVSEVMRFVIKLGLDKLEEGVGNEMRKILEEESRKNRNDLEDFEVISKYMMSEEELEEDGYYSE